MVVESIGKAMFASIGPSTAQRCLLGVPSHRREAFAGMTV